MSIVVLDDWIILYLITVIDSVLMLKHGDTDGPAHTSNSFQNRRKAFW